MVEHQDQSNKFTQKSIQKVGEIDQNTTEQEKDQTAEPFELRSQNFDYFHILLIFFDSSKLIPVLHISKDLFCT